MTVMSAPAQVAAATAVRWPADGGALLGVPGFIESRFNPLVRRAVDGCLADAAFAGPGAHGDRTAVLLVTSFGDATTTDLASRRLALGQVHNPLLFYQSVPTSILGFITREHGITGPITCLSVHPGSTGEAMETAELMLCEEGIDQLLLIGVELASTPRTTAAQQQLPSTTRFAQQEDAAISVLLRPAHPNGTGEETVIDLRAEPADLRAEPAPGMAPSDSPAPLGHLLGTTGLWGLAAQRVPVSSAPSLPVDLRRQQDRTGI